MRLSSGSVLGVVTLIFLGAYVKETVPYNDASGNPTVHVQPEIDYSLVSVLFVSCIS